MIRDESRVVYLRVYTWQGMSLGAQHWYAELQKDEEDNVELKAPLTQRHATMLNKGLQRQGYHFRHRRGEMYGGFLTKEETVELGKERWAEIFPGSVLLILGGKVTSSPQPILIAPEGVDIEELNTIPIKFDNMGWYKAHYERGANEHNTILDELGDEWAEKVSAILEAA